jgi:hypothetical protein
VLPGLPYTKEWRALVGAPNRVPADPDYLALMQRAGSLLFLGLGRLMSYVPARVMCSLDLCGCDCALLLDRVNNGTAHQRQVYLDNRKSGAERLLEGPHRTAELLLARGVKVVVGTGSIGSDHS